MKRILATFFGSIVGLSLFGGNGVVTELSRNFEFQPDRNAVSITDDTSGITLPQEFSDNFLIRFALKNKGLKEGTDILNLGNVLEMGVKKGELQATVALCDSLTGDKTVVRNMTIGVPLSYIDLSKNEHDVAVYYNGSHFSLYVDGRLYDNDFPIGTPSAGRVETRMSDAVRDLTLSVSPLKVARTGGPTFAEVQYWTPPYHNAWVGDVATCWANGRYHVFYLFDRRGHGSKFGKGGHYFEHLSSADLVNWTEHEEATPIEEQWETFGTGTPFEKDGKLYLTYGLHTTRIYPQERTIQPRIKDDVKQYGATRCIDYDTLTDLKPAGATYAVSEDGGNTFRKSHKLFHYCENPSIWVDDSGELKMYANYGARGSWKSGTLDSGWECTDANFPEGRDCTFPFTLGDYEYVVGGFGGMWRRPKGGEVKDFVDIAKIGEDCYDGLSVPAVTTLPDGRTLTAGWIKMQNWGGALAIHEIVECSDGVPGTKFVEELIPDLPFIGEVAAGETKNVPASYRYDFEFVPEKKGTGKMVLKFADNAYWTLDLDSDYLWYSSNQGDRTKSLAEGGHVSTAHDYSIPARLKNAERIPVRVVVKYDPKYDGSVIDIEVNGNRSMISYRPGLKSAAITRL